MINHKEEHVAEKLKRYLDQGLTNEEIVERMNFVVEDMTLSHDEAIEFLNFVRSAREKNIQ